MRKINLLTKKDSYVFCKCLIKKITQNYRLFFNEFRTVVISNQFKKNIYSFIIPITESIDFN